MCKLCDEMDKDIELNDWTVFITVDNNKHQLGVEKGFNYLNGDNNYAYIDIEYCPLCGKELKNK